MTQRYRMPCLCGVPSSDVIPWPLAVDADRPHPCPFCGAPALYRPQKAKCRQSPPVTGDDYRLVYGIPITNRDYARMMGWPVRSREEEADLIAASGY